MAIIELYYERIAANNNFAMHRLCFVVALVAVVGVEGLAHSRIIQLDYDGFCMWLDCDRRGMTRIPRRLQIQD